MANLGRLESVNLRTVWLSESGDFTPWLAQESNLKLLGGIIGLDLGLESTEKNVGLFRADIVCKDTVTGSWILIENQLERTDHSHLGQLLTYAAGLNAVTIVWVSEKFTDEHRAALDWLNEITDQEINFFGLEIELWKIGDSQIAPKFNIISKPNDWTKTITASRQITGNNLTETEQLHLEYWTALKNRLEIYEGLPQARKPRGQHWYDFAIGRSGFLVRAVTGMRDGYIGLQLIMYDKYSKAYFAQLVQDKESIESDAGMSFEWRELPDNKQSDISIFRHNVNPSDQSNWDEYHTWLQKRLEDMYRAFEPRIKELVIESHYSEEELFHEDTTL